MDKYLQKPPENQMVWIKLGLDILGKRGRKHLKIAHMCEQLDVTKGAFYHWFSSKKDFERKMLGMWKQQYTQAFIENAEKGGDSKEKLSLLGKQCINAAIYGDRLEFEINAWSFEDKEVKAFVTSVYKQRYQYLEKLLLGIYDDKKEVKKHALILYSLVVGIDFFYRELSTEELNLIFSDYI